jgi:hypothetical protein
MAIKNSGYGEKVTVGYDEVSKRETNDDGSANPAGKALEYRESDTFDNGEHFVEVVGLSVFEDKNGDDYRRAWFRAANGKMIRDFGKVTSRNMFLLDSMILGIFGKVLPVEEIQGPSGRMPTKTRTEALGWWVKIKVDTDEAYEGQNVRVIDGRWKAPDSATPMYDHKTHEATGKVPTSALVDGSSEESSDQDW